MHKNFPRMTITTLVAVGLLALIALAAPQQLPVTIYKLSLVTLAAVAGYWVDREMFPYARPDNFLPGEEIADSLDDLTQSITFKVGNTFALDILASAAMLRRAVIVGAFVIGVTLGL